MTKAHLKRMAAPKTWNVERKTTKFITRAKPGAHTIQLGIPLTVFFKEILKKVKTTKELKFILHTQEILVDGKKRHDTSSMIGFMDVMSIPKTKENYRVLINTKNKLYAQEINEKESKIKPCKLIRKTVLGKDKIQLSFTDGRTILVKKNDYKTGDTLILEIPSQKIIEHIKLDKGCTIMLYNGKHVGIVGKVDDIQGNTINLTANKKKYETHKKYAFVIGQDKPTIKIAE